MLIQFFFLLWINIAVLQVSGVCPTSDCYGTCKTIEYACTQEHRIFASISELVYNEPDIDFLDEYGNYKYIDSLGIARELTSQSPLSKWELVYQYKHDEDTSYEILIYKDIDKYNYIVGLRGNWSPRDIYADAHIVTGTLWLSQRYRRTRDKIIDFFSDKHIHKIQYTGHSLGGALAVEMVKYTMNENNFLGKGNFIADKTYSAIIFNAGSSCLGHIDETWDITSIRAYGDPVSALGKGLYKTQITISEEYMKNNAIIPPNYLAEKGYPNNYIQTHAMTIFIECPEGLHKTDSDLLPICTPPGCKDEAAINYNPNAKSGDNKLCKYAGCMDNDALNYNPQANVSKDECLYIEVETQSWIHAKHYDPENDDLMDDELQIIRKKATKNMESMDSNAIRHSDIAELQFNTPRKRYLRFEYPTMEAFDLMTTINKDECLKFGLGPPQRHFKENTITHWDGMDTWSRMTKDGTSVSETFSGSVNIKHKVIKENEIWCSIPYNATTFETTEYNETLKTVSYVYGSKESPRATVARVMKLLELYSDKSDAACDEWNAVANGGFRYSSMQGDCEASGWVSPSKKDCDLSSDMMQWFKYYEHQPLTYICGGEVYFSKYENEAPNLVDYYENELVQWTGTDLLNHFDLFGFYVISKNGTTLEDFIKDNPNAHAQDIHDKLQEIYCTEYGIEIEDCTWHQFYVPLRYVDHYTRVDHSSVANRDLMLVDIDFPDSLCKLDLRIEKDSLSAIETTTYNALQENIVKGYVSLRTWADQECYTGDLCLLGIKSIEKQDKGIAIPIPFTPFDVGFSNIVLDLSGFALVYSKETKVSYCYNIHQESAEMYGPKVVVSPLAFEPFSRSVSSMKSKAAKKAAALASKLSRSMLANAKKRIFLAKFALGRAKVKRSWSDSVAKMDLPPFRKDRLQQRIDARKYRKDAAKAKAIILKNGGFDSYFLRAVQISLGVRDALRFVFNGAAKTFSLAKTKSIKARDWLAGTMLGKAVAGAPASLRSMFNKRLTQLKAWRQKVKFNKLYVSTIKKNRAEALKATKTIQIARGKKIAERLAKRRAANLAKGGRKKLQNSWKTYKKRLKRERFIKTKATIQLRREQFKKNINQLKREQWGIPAKESASLRLQARLQKRRLFLEKRGGNSPRGNGKAVASSDIDLGGVGISETLRKRLLLRRKMATSNLKGTTISQGNPVSIHGSIAAKRVAMLLKKKQLRKRILTPNLGAPKPRAIPVPGTDAANSLERFKQFNGNPPSRRRQADPFNKVGWLTLERRTRQAAKYTRSDKRLAFRNELLDKMQGKKMKHRVAVQEAAARLEYRKKKIAEQRININPVQFNAKKKALHTPLNLNSQNYPSHLSKVYKAESISAYRKTLQSPINAGNIHMAFVDYRRFQHQPGVQHYLGKKIPESHDPPPEEVEEVGVYPEEEVPKNIFQLMREAHILGSMTRENFWYELGYCRNPPCPLMSRRTGFSLDSDLTVATQGRLGKYEWSNIALEITTFNTGVKGTAFRAVNFDSRASVAGGNGWDRTLWNGQTQLYIPGAFDAFALTSVGGFLSELLRFSGEVGMGHGLMRFRFHPPKRVDGDFESINPVAVHSNMCLSENTQMGVEDIMTRPSEQPCHHTHSHSGKIRLNYPSVEKFINCPITHYLNVDECIMYDQNEIPPLVQYDEHWLLGKVSTCAGNHVNLNMCEIYEDSDDLHSHYSSLLPDYIYVNKNIPDYQRIRDSFLYSLEYMGVRDTLQEHPYTDTRASTLPLSIITEENCEIFGLSPIYALAEPANSYVKELVKSLYNDVNISIYDNYIIEDYNGIQKLGEDLFPNKEIRPMFKSKDIIFDQDKLELEDRVPTVKKPHNYEVNEFVPFEHPYIPYGVSIVPYARDKFTTKLTIVHKDKGYYGYHYEKIYGREPSFDPKCTDEYKCVCFKGNEYIYTTYDIKPEKDTDYIYTYQPIMSHEECQVAATAMGEEVDTYHDRIWYHDHWLMMEEENVTIDKTLSRVGCFKVGEEIFFNDKAYDVDSREGTTANLYSDSHSASVIKVIRAKNKVVEDRTPRIVVKTPMEVLTSTQEQERVLNPKGRFLYSGTNAGRAMIPIERNFKPFKYKPEDTDDGIESFYLHEVNNENITTYRYMKEEQSYSASNNDLIEKITSKGTINFDQYGEKENLQVTYDDATVSLAVGSEERLDYRPQIIEDVIVGVENVLAHKFAAVGTMRTFPKPIFGDIDSDADTDLLVSDELRSRHLYLSTDNYRYNLANEDSSGIDNIDLGDYITPSFVDITNVTGMDILTANRLTGEIKLWKNPGGGTTIDVDDMFEVDDRYISIYGSSVAMFRSDGRNENQTQDLLYIGSGSWNDTHCEITTKNNTMVIEGFNKTLCDTLTVTWDNDSKECEIGAIFTEWECESLRSIFLLNCTEITHTMTYGNEYDMCQHIPHWSDSQCIFILDKDRCDGFEAEWHDMTCMRWDRLEPGVDEDTCYAENPITCLNTLISEGDSKCTLSGNSEYNVTYESCSQNNAKWTPAYCELWYTYDDNVIATRVLVESNGDCSDYDPIVGVYTYEEYNEILSVNCTLYNETVIVLRDTPDGLDDSELVDWGTEQCETYKATFISSTCTHAISTSYGLTRNECRGYNPTWTHPWETKKIDCMWGDREGLGADVKTRDCNPELEYITVTDSDSGYKVGDVVTFAAVGDGSNAGDFGSFNYTLVEGDIRILKGVKLGDLTGTLPNITGGNAVARATTNAVISGGSGTGLVVDVTTLNCETVLGNINCPGIEKITVHNSAAGYEVGDVITFATVGDGSNAGDYGSFEYTLVEGDIILKKVKLGDLTGTLPVDVDVKTRDCKPGVESINVTSSGSGYEVGDIINFAAKGDGNNAGDYGSFEYTLVAEDLTPASGIQSIRTAPVSGTLPVITGNDASGTKTNAVMSGGSGTGLVVDVTTLNCDTVIESINVTECPGLESITVKRAGSGYEVGDVITFDAVGDGSNAGDYGSFQYTIVAGDFRSLGVQTVKTGHLSGTMPTVTAANVNPGTTTNAANTGIGNTIKYGDIVNFNNTPAVNTGDEIELWNGQWNRLHDQPGHPAYYYDGTYLIGKEDTVEYYNRDGTLFTQYNDGKTLVNLDYIDIFYDGKLTGGGVNIDLTAIPCKALAKSNRSYYLNENQDLIEIPTHEFLIHSSGELSSDNITNRVCGHLPITTINNSISCTESHSFPNTCPEGYGLVHSKWENTVYNHTTEYAIHFIRGEYTQCAPCPDDTMSPDGHTRCLGHEFKLKNTNLFIDLYEPTVFATHLQKYHNSKGNAYFPTIHSQDGIDYIDNEVYSDTKFLRCETGYVPKPKGIPDVSDSLDVKNDVLSHYSGTCSGYTCQRCPVNFIEENQRCVPCPPGKLAGWEVSRYSGTQYVDNVCITVNVPTGHFMDVQNPEGVTIGNNSYPYTTHCDHWLYHPAGGLGAYQNEENQYKCKTATPGSKAVINLNTRVVTTWNNPGQKVSNDRTRAINCAEYEVCDGEQIIGCEPGHIWYRQTNDREDEECVKCNEDDSIYVLHGEKDDYEYCDGTYKFQCDLGTHTYGDILDGDYAKRYVGIRDTWKGSNLVHYTPQTNKSIDGSNQYVYRPDWDMEKARIETDLPWVTKVAHAGEISALANRGDMVVSGGRSYDGGEALKLWNKKTGTYIPLNGQSGSINSVDIAPDGTIVSASYDGSVALWSSLGNLIWTTTHHVENTATYNKEVNSVAFSPSGTQIVSGGSDGSVIIQDIDGDLNQTLTGHSEVYTVAWGDFIVSGGKDNVRTWENGESTVLIDVPYVASVAIHGSNVIAAAGKTIYINDTSTNIAASSNVYALAFSPDGQYFVSVGDDIQVWGIDRTLKRQMPQSRLRTNIEAYGHVIAYNTYNPSVILNDQSIKSVAWGTEIITGGKDRTIRIWKDWDQNNRTHVRLSMVDWHEQSKCLPVPDEYFALDNEWKLHSCGYAKEHCIHRTFHRIYPFIYPTVTAPKYMFTQAVRETSYDEIFRFTDRQCENGYLKDGCLKEYCSREGQTNCWCGEEEDFCTMACVDGMCVPACSDQVCDPDYEICFGVGDSGRCARVCVGPSDNFCVTDEGGVKMCRHYNEDWNSTRLQQLVPKPDSPCFDEMPNIPETQCKNIFQVECFCNRDFLDNEHNTCLDKKIEPQCSVPQDDGTCTYMPQEDLTKRDCVCGNELTEQTCYQKEGKCGVHATVLQDCSDLLSTMNNTRTHETTSQCRPTGEESLVNPSQCRKATNMKKSFGSWDDFSETFTCDGEDYNEPGCIDPHADNYNQYAVIPKQCEYL